MSNKKEPPFFNDKSMRAFHYKLPFYDTMELFIETLTGTCFELRVLPFEAVISVKAKIQRLEGTESATVSCEFVDYIKAISIVFFDVEDLKSHFSCQLHVSACRGQTSHFAQLISECHLLEFKHIHVC